MRDIVITLIVFGSIPFILTRPYVGIVMWSWIGYMNPHRLSWGFAYDFPFAQVIAVATLVGLFIYKEEKKIPLNNITIIWYLYVLWLCLTTVFALEPEYAVEGLKRMIKIQLVAFLTIMLMTTRHRLEALVWTIVVSLGYYSVKGGIFSVLSGSAHRVYGPEGSFIFDNNSLGLAMIMTLPFMRYLQITTQNKYIKWGLIGAMLLTCVAILSTHSRGAFLALITMTLFLWLKSSKKMWLGAAIAVILPVLLLSMPQHWYDRMATLNTYEEDKSAMGRITAWKFAFDMASQRFMGGGYDSFSEQNYWTYSPDIAAEVQIRDGRYQGAHSIYFETLGEHGFIGLFLFIMLGVLAYKSASWVIANARGDPDLKWVSELAAMAQVSLIGYAVAGAFLSLAKFDLFYHIVGIIVLLRYMTEKKLKNKKDETQLPGARPRDAPVDNRTY